MHNDVKDIDDHINGCRHRLRVFKGRPCNRLRAYAVQHDLEKVFLSYRLQDIIYHFSRFFSADQVPNQVKQLGLNSRIILHRMHGQTCLLCQHRLTSFDSALFVSFRIGTFDLNDIAVVEAVGRP